MPCAGMLSHIAIFGTMDPLYLALVCCFHIAPLGTQGICNGFKSISLFEQDSALKVPLTLHLKPAPLEGRRNCGILGFSDSGVVA